MYMYNRMCVYMYHTVVKTQKNEFIRKEKKDTLTPLKKNGRL